jgi:flagellar protein FlaG
MPGSSASHLIWFIAAITVAVAVVSALTASVLELTEGMEDRTDSLSGELRADIEIVNDPEMVPYEQATSTIHVYVKNTGSEALDMRPDLLLAFINGTATEADSVTVVGGSSTWAPGITVEAEFTVAGLVEGSYYQMKVSASQYDGVWDAMDFMVSYI